MNQIIKDVCQRRDELLSLIQATCLTSEELARKLGISVSLVQAWRKRGIGPVYFRLGHPFNSPVLYPIDSVDEWVKHGWNRQRGYHTNARK